MQMESLILFTLIVKHNIQLFISLFEYSEIKIENLLFLYEYSIFVLFSMYALYRDLCKFATKLFKSNTESNILCMIYLYKHIFNEKRHQLNFTNFWFVWTIYCAYFESFRLVQTTFLAIFANFWLVQLILSSQS